MTAAYHRRELSLAEQQQADDFWAGLDQWHTFKRFGPAKGWWQDVVFQGKWHSVSG